MPGRRTNGYKAKVADRRPKPRPVSAIKKMEQKMWRRDSLVERMRTLGKFTKKNGEEAARLGYKVRTDISCYPIGLRE